MARIVRDGWASGSRGIAVDRETAVLVDQSGDATIIANADHPTPYAYFISGGVPELCEPNTPLTYQNLSVFAPSQAAGSTSAGGPVAAARRTRSTWWLV